MSKPLVRVVFLAAVALLSTDIAHAKLGFVYVNHTDNPNSVSGFAVAPTGALTVVPGSPFPTGGQSFSNFFAATSVRWVRRGGETLLYASNGFSARTIAAF